MKTEAELTAMQPQARDHLEPPEGRKGAEGSSPGALGDGTTLPALPAATLTLDFWPPDWEGIRFCYVKNTVLIVLVTAATGNRHRM